MDVVPLLDPRPGEEAVPAVKAELAPAGMAALLLQVVPQLEQRREVGGLVPKGGVRLVGRLALLQGPVARVLHAQGGADHQHLPQAVPAPGGEQHAADARVDGQPGQLAAQGCHPPPRVDRPQLFQHPVAVPDQPRIGRVDEGEGGGLAEPQQGHLEYHRREVGSQDLRLGEGGPGEEVLLRIEPDADTRGDPPAAPLALVGAGLGYALDRKALHLAAVAVAADSRVAGVDDVAYAGDGEGSLRHVGGQYDPSKRPGVEYPSLLAGAEPRVERQHLGQRQPVLAKGFGGLADLALAAQEHQDVSPVDTGQLVHGVQDRLLHRFVALAALLLFDRPVADLHRVGAAGDVDDRGVGEVPREALRVDRGRGDDQPELRAPGQDALQVTEQEVDVEAALVRLVDDQGVVLVEQTVALNLRQQYAVGHQLDAGLGPDVVVEPHLVADHRPGLALQLLGDARGQAAGGDAPRLGVTDTAEDAAPEGEAELGQLGRFARSGLAAEDDDLVGTNQLGDLVPPPGDGEFLRESGHGEGLPPSSGYARGVAHLVRERVGLLRRRRAALDGLLQFGAASCQATAVPQQAGIYVRGCG